MDKLLPPNHGQRITPLLVPRLLSPGLFKPETAFILKHFSFEFDLLLKLFKIYFTRMCLDLMYTDVEREKKSASNGKGRGYAPPPMIKVSGTTGLLFHYYRTTGLVLPDIL